MARFKNVFIALGIIAVLFAMGFRVEHPHSGFKTAVGSASSSIVLVKKSSLYAVGDKVVAASASADLSPVLGQVSQVNGTKYSVGNGVFLESVEGTKIDGKMVVVLPFFGYIFGALGL